MYKVIVIVFFCLIVNSIASEYDSIEIIKRSETVRDMWGNHKEKNIYCLKFKNEDGIIRINYLGDDIKPFLDSSSGAFTQMEIYKMKKIWSITGTILFLGLGILSATAGMEETGTKTTSVDENGKLITKNDKKMTDAGYVLLGLSGISGLTALYCSVTPGINLNKAAKLHNKSITSKVSLQLGFKIKI
jgi:hypothetical protein